MGLYVTHTYRTRENLIPGVTGDFLWVMTKAAPPIWFIVQIPSRYKNTVLTVKTEPSNDYHKVKHPKADRATQEAYESTGNAQGPSVGNKNPQDGISDESNLIEVANARYPTRDRNKLSHKGFCNRKQ